ncbi:hypothetical protein EVG20_g886 [Dentipellis fragilis]|uniref:Uncharacterized protein n=1 Tax=Dentipellis fragilis TaxID=205917 RepID=A0A4Y9ZFC1_9AGAM|nr:hypothetical protein EVG20_g886 [Dentipellis fragilis]
MKQISVDEMLKTYIPGPSDPSLEIRANFMCMTSINHGAQDPNNGTADARDERGDIRNAKPKTTWVDSEWRCMIEIVRFAPYLAPAPTYECDNSVRSSSPLLRQHSAPVFNSGPRLKTYDTSGWSVRFRTVAPSAAWRFPTQHLRRRVRSTTIDLFAGNSARAGRTLG